MYKSQKGFTLVELVVVIVLLGILGVTALGKFENLSGQAADATESGIAAELSSAAAINYAARITGGATSGVTISTADCVNGAAPGAALDSLMASGSAPTTNLTYAIVAGGDVTTEDNACASGLTYNCSVTNAQGAVAGGATASIICTGP